MDDRTRAQLLEALDPDLQDARTVLVVGRPPDDVLETLVLRMGFPGLVLHLLDGQEPPDPLPGVHVRQHPLVDASYEEEVDVVLLWHLIPRARSLVGALMRAHHALVPGGRFAAVEDLEDEAPDEDGPSTPRTPPPPQAHAGELEHGDVIHRGTLWRLLTETGFRGIRFRQLEDGTALALART